MSTQSIHDYIERLGNLLRNELRRAGGEHGLQPVQLEALHYLSICNRYSDTPMAVTEYLGQTKGTVSQSLKVLEKKRLISKHADANDGRITHLRVTRAGLHLIAATIPTPVFSNACENLPERSQQKIVESLRDLLHAVQRANDMKSFGVCSTCRYHRVLGKNDFLCGLTEEPLSEDDIQLICREHEHAA